MKKNIYIRDQVTDLFQHKYVIDIFIDKKEVRPEQFHTVQPYIKCKRKLFYQCLINVQILIKNRNYFFLYERYRVYHFKEFYFLKY